MDKANEIFETKATYNKWLKELTEGEKDLVIEMINEALRIHDVVEQSEQLKCDCCNGTGMVEGDYRDEVESCLTCNGRGTF
jgi:DnaJ-class molecular chaperone